MKKTFAVILTLAVMFTMFSMTASARTHSINYYDEHGNHITINGLYYNSHGHPMFNASSYYLDENGNSVFVGGCRVYYYNADGDLVPGRYYYDADGNAVTRPSSYPGGFGCGAWYYNVQGDIVNSTIYYDDFGNPVDPPTVQPRAHHGGWGWGNRGGGCHRWR